MRTSGSFFTAPFVTMGAGWRPQHTEHSDTNLCSPSTVSLNNQVIFRPGSGLVQGRALSLLRGVQNKAPPAKNTSLTEYPQLCKSGVTIVPRRKVQTDNPPTAVVVTRELVTAPPTSGRRRRPAGGGVSTTAFKKACRRLGCLLALPVGSIGTADASSAAETAM